MRLRSELEALHAALRMRDADLHAHEHIVRGLADKLTAESEARQKAQLALADKARALTKCADHGRQLGEELHMHRAQSTAADAPPTASRHAHARA